jgi:uncharacterized membrane protein YczE
LACRMLLARRVLQLLVGLLLYGISIAMMIRAAIGVSPWEVFSQGVSLRTGIPFGWVVNIVGALVLLLWIPLRQRPGAGTVANVILVGPAAELGLALIPSPGPVWADALLFAAGLAVLAVATGLYIGARFGAGPRDGLMTGIHRRFGAPIWAARAVVELTVLTVGWVLGGNVGVGTVAFALLIGPMVDVTLPVLRVPEAASEGDGTGPLPAG